MNKLCPEQLAGLPSCLSHQVSQGLGAAAECRSFSSLLSVAVAATMCVQASCICVLYLVTVGSSLAQINWKSSVDLEPEGEVRLSWTPHVDRIVFQVEARTLGYVGVGFSPEGSMMGADIVIGWVDDSNQQAFLLDYHSTSKKDAPVLDTVQNYELLGGSQNVTHTVLRFQRPWDTCDQDQDRRLGDNTERIIWAMHKEDPQQGGQGFLAWHSKVWRGSRSVHLVSVANPRPNGTLQSDTMHWDVVLTNFSVPKNMDTLYWCKIFRIPHLTRKHHIIGYEPLISAGSVNVVHHMLLYECAIAAGLMEQYLSHPGAACDSPAMPRLWEHCVTPSFAWSSSSTGEFLPEHVGIPIAESKRSTFFMLEIHYDNPTLKQVIDSSGLRLYYTDKLRQNEGAMLVTGVVISPFQVIPPGQKAYKTAGYCDFHCTHSTLPSGINIISALLHTHRAGSEITLRHVRAGLELAPIAQDRTYDFKYQQSRVLVEERQVLPGDEIITECVYNTAARNTPTIGGYSTQQEMCLGFITYYPRATLASCLSMTPVDFFFQIFGVKKFYHYNMTMIEQMFLQLTDLPSMKKTTSTTPPSFPKLSGDDEINALINEQAISTLKKMADFSIESGEENNLFDNLIIEDPEEFQNRSFTSHLYKLPWAEDLFTKPIEQAVYKGKHMTFCRLFNDSLQTAPQVFKFPNFTELENSSLNAVCPQRKDHPSAIAPNKSERNNMNCFITSVLFVGLINLLLS